ncbi:hypothetical protein F4778DRAFT_731193 [Xylariomycetidae sp. FL2044]|nr:hypothetical protein F4778DRAFT_731193 [Xylariomycetidae sp. FL2044]
MILAEATHAILSLNSCTSLARSPCPRFLHRTFTNACPNLKSKRHPGKVKALQRKTAKKSRLGETKASQLDREHERRPVEGKKMELADANANASQTEKAKIQQPARTNPSLTGFLHHSQHPKLMWRMRSTNIRYTMSERRANIRIKLSGEAEGWEPLPAQTPRPAETPAPAEGPQPAGTILSSQAELLPMTPQEFYDLEGVYTRPSDILTQIRCNAGSLVPVDAHKRTPYSLVRHYTNRLERGNVVLIRNLPGFLDTSSTWIDHSTSPSGDFTPWSASQEPPRAMDFPLPRAMDFPLLRDILASAAPASTSPEPAHMGVTFDGLETALKIGSAMLEGDRPPLLEFRNWLQQSEEFQHFSFNEVIEEIQNSYRKEPRQFVPFTAPLAFVRAVHLYNQQQQDAWIEGQQSHHIVGIGGLVILKDEMTQSFPFPEIIRNIGTSTFKTKSCSIRVGVRPIRTSLRCHKHSTAVVGQLAGYSVATLVKPHLALLQGQGLECHPSFADIPEFEHARAGFTTFGKTSFGVPNPRWTRELEAELSQAGDLLLASLRPGDGLLVPQGWWYQIRSINNQDQLHATVTWILGQAYLDDEEITGDDFVHPLTRIAPRVDI